MTFTKIPYHYKYLAVGYNDQNIIQRTIAVTLLSSQNTILACFEQKPGKYGALFAAKNGIILKRARGGPIFLLPNLERWRDLINSIQSRQVVSLYGVYSNIMYLIFPQVFSSQYYVPHFFPKSFSSQLRVPSHVSSFSRVQSCFIPFPNPFLLSRVQLCCLPFPNPFFLCRVQSCCLPFPIPFLLY